MAPVEPKSGKLSKLSQGLFGPKWTEKWVHLDQHVLKYFSMASEQTQMFALWSARQSFSIELAAYDFVLQEDKRITRKHSFHLVPKNKTSKPYVFACSNEKELLEWQEACQARSLTTGSSDIPSFVAEKLRRASEAFGACDSRRSDRVDVSKLRLLLQSVDWQGDISEYSLIQQQLDPNVEGKISRDLFLRVMKHYFMARANKVSSISGVPAKTDSATPRSSFSDHPQQTKHSELSEPEVASEREPCEAPHHSNNTSSPSSDPLDDLGGGDIPSTEAANTRDWSLDFRRSQTDNLEVDVVTRGLQMAAFLAEFQLAGEQAIQAIVSEIAVDEDLRTIRTLPLDDDQFLATDYSDKYESTRASLSKYAVNGLLVYISHHQASHTLFGHQLRAARAIHEAISFTRASALQVPLQCVIDYIGFRALVVAPTLPHLNKITSSRMLMCDRNTQNAIFEELHSVFKHLGFIVEDFGKGPDLVHDRLPTFVGAAAGVSMTSADNGQQLCYLHNLVDIFPSVSQPDGASPLMLRPELVATLDGSLPLHPQYSSYSFSVEQRTILEQAVEMADERLRCVVIPRLVEAVEAHTTDIYDSLTLREALHREGVNARYLGLCFEGARFKHSKRLFFSEMIARACKREFQESINVVFCEVAKDIRQEIKVLESHHEGEEGHESFSMDSTLETDSSRLHSMSRELVQDSSMRVAIEFFNLVFGRTAKDSIVFWKDHILPRVRNRFVFSTSCALADLIDTPEFDDLVYLPQLFQAVLYHTNVRVIDDSCVNLSSPQPFADPELFVLMPRSTLLCETTSGCKRALSEPHQTVYDGNVANALQHVITQIAIIDTAPRGDLIPGLGRLLGLAADLSLSLGQTQDAERYVVLALEASSARSVERARALLIKIKLLHEQLGPLEDMRSLFLEAVQIVNDFIGCVHPLVFDFYTTMIGIYCHRGDLEGAIHEFEEVAVLVKDCFGRNSLAYADIRREQADLLMRMGRSRDATSILDEAFSLYERLALDNAGDKALVADVKLKGAACLQTMAKTEVTKSSKTELEAAFTAAVKALAMCRELVSEDHAVIISLLLQLGELCVHLGDNYRVLQYYRPALMHLKATPDGHQAQLRKVSQAVLNARIQSLAADKVAVVDKTKKRFAAIVASLENALVAESNIYEDQTVPSRELELIRQITHELLELDPVEYLDRLINQADEEWRALRRERFTSETIRRDSTAEEPTVSGRFTLAVPSSSRFASFAIGQSHHPTETTVPPPAPSILTNTIASEPVASLFTPAGEFTYGGQLATLLFLASLPDE